MPRLIEHSKNFEPIRLVCCLSGWPPKGPNNFRWKHDHLAFQGDLPINDHGPNYLGEFVKPSSSQWQEFWRVCDEIYVWSWPSYLGNAEVYDGLQWDLELQEGNRYVASKGQVIGCEDFIGENLKRLHQILQAMAGWDNK
jgi:hypothetical protein